MRSVSGVCFAVILFAGTLSAQMPVTFTHEPIGCVSSACGRAAVNAKVESTVPLQSVRVYFNNGAGPEYYVEMLHGGDWNFKAILPAVEKGTTSIAYRIVAIAEDGSVYDGPSALVVVSEACAPTPLTGDQAALAMNTAIGLTDDSQTGDPDGFSCVGLVKVISPSEVMSDNTACEETRLAKTDGCMEEGAGAAAGEAATVAGASNSKVIAFTAAGLAVGAGGAIIYYENKDEPVSRARP